MDQQQLFNVLFALVGVLGGWWMKAMWEAIKSLEQADKALGNQVAALLGKSDDDLDQIFVLAASL